MIKNEKAYGVFGKIKKGIGYISRVISASLFPGIVEGAGNVMKNIDNKIIQIEKRIIRKIFSLIVIFIGGLFLIFALFFFLKEYWGWSNAVTFFSIGMIIFVIGLLLKLNESDT